MIFIGIVPTTFMKDAFLTSDITLVLSHLVEKGNDYQKACLDFKKAGGKLILDNGFYEKKENPPLSSLAHKANLIKADVVCLPDLPMSDNLRGEIEKNINLIRGYGYYGQLMMCVWAQGRDWEEDFKYFKILNSIKKLDIIALPYCFGTRVKDKYKRPYFLNMIERSGISIYKKIHLFGSPSWDDLKKSNREWIDTIDGTLPWKVGYANKFLPIGKDEEPSRSKNYFNIKDISRRQRACINYNCEKIKEVLKNGKS